MNFLYIKALHIIFVVTWFSGMFYLVRLFIYNREANDKTEPEKSILQNQFNLMIKRLHFGITVPSAILTLIFGYWLIFILYPGISLIPVWLWIKIGFVTVLYVYQFTLHIIYKNQLAGDFRLSSNFLRIWNELPTVILVAVVMLVVVRESMSLVYGMVGLIAFIILIMSGIKIYKRIREQ